MPSGLPTILLVEDDADLLEILHAVLATEGYRVLAASDAEAGLGYLLTETPAMVIAGCSMPDQGGLGIADRMAADPRWRGIPIIIISGSRARRPLENVVAWLGKPVSLDVLLEQVRATLT
jgi:DNA-binding response OmpR family regulator